MEKPARTFNDQPAVRGQMPVWAGLVGPSGGGKTMSALELATGIQEATGGDIYGIDTEARRMLHYADYYNFRHMEFVAPFGSADYLSAVEHCYSKGAKIIIIDSASHQHEGSGGFLEQQDAEVQRLSKGDPAKYDKVKFLAWVKPKAEERRMINSLLQMQCSFIFCFRAKEKIKPQTGRDPLHLGWQPITSDAWIYEMMINFLLPPAANGVPEWNPEQKAEKQMIKIPRQFRDVFTTAEPLSRKHGRILAEWAAGEKRQPATKPLIPQPVPPAINKMLGAFAALGVTGAMIERRLDHPVNQITEPELADLREIHIAITKGAMLHEYFQEAS